MVKPTYCLYLQRQTAAIALRDHSRLSGVLGLAAAATAVKWVVFRDSPGAEDHDRNLLVEASRRHIARPVCDLAGRLAWCRTEDYLCARHIANQGMRLAGVCCHILHRRHRDHHRCIGRRGGSRFSGRALMARVCCSRGAPSLYVEGARLTTGLQTS